MTQVSIYHRTGRDMFMEASHVFSYGGEVAFELAYTYDTDRDDLEQIFRDNNAVDGTEINVEKNKRSLSIGDVVVLGYNILYVTPREVHEVQSIGFAPVDERKVIFALWKARSAGVVV